MCLFLVQLMADAGLRHHLFWHVHFRVWLLLLLVASVARQHHLLRLLGEAPRQVARVLVLVRDLHGAGGDVGDLVQMLLGGGVGRGWRAQTSVFGLLRNERVQPVQRSLVLRDHLVFDGVGYCGLYRFFHVLFELSLESIVVEASRNSSLRIPAGGRHSLAAGLEAAEAGRERLRLSLAGGVANVVFKHGGGVAFKVGRMKVQRPVSRSSFKF